MSQLARQRCFNHARREAAARCPQCRNYFCHECVTDHEGLAVCAPCLAALSPTGGDSAPSRSWLARGALGLAAFTVLWIAFFLLGQGLLQLPDVFHDGELWRKGVSGAP